MLDTRGEVKLLQGSYEAQFSIQRELLERDTIQKVASVQSSLEACFIESADSFVTFLSGLENALEEEKTRLLARLAPLSWRAWIWPSANDAYRAAAEDWFTRSIATVIDERNLILNAPRTLEGKRDAIITFTRTYRFDATSLNGDLAVLFQEYLYAQDEAKYIQREAEMRLREHRDSLLHRFGSEVAAVHEKLTHKIQEWNDRMRLKKEVLQREAATVGIEL